MLFWQYSLASGRLDGVKQAIERIKAQRRRRAAVMKVMKAVGGFFGLAWRLAFTPIALFVGSVLAAVGMVHAAGGGSYTPETDIASIQVQVLGYISTGAHVVVAVVTAALGIAAIIWIVCKVKQAFFGEEKRTYDLDGDGMEWSVRDDLPNRGHDDDSYTASLRNIDSIDHSTQAERESGD